MARLDEDSAILRHAELGNHVIGSLARIAVILATPTVVGCASSLAQQSVAEGQCPERLGEQGTPSVSDPETASTIFLANEQYFAPLAKPQDFPNVTVEDAGHSWLVYRWREPREYADGRIEITAGSANRGVALMIAKCDGRISQANFGR